MCCQANESSGHSSSHYHYDDDKKKKQKKKDSSLAEVPTQDCLPAVEVDWVGMGILIFLPQQLVVLKDAHGSTCTVCTVK